MACFENLVKAFIFVSCKSSESLEGKSYSQGVAMVGFLFGVFYGVFILTFLWVVSKTMVDKNQEDDDET